MNDPEQAELHATAPLEALAGALAALPGHAAAQLAEAEARIMPRLRDLYAALEVLRQRVRDAQSALSKAESPEARDAALQRLLAAQLAETRLRVALVGVENALGRYKAAAWELDMARRGAFLVAEQHLRAIVGDVTAYAEIPIPRHADGAAASLGAGGQGAPSLPPLPEPADAERLNALNIALFELFDRSDDQARRYADHWDHKILRGDRLADFERLRKICARDATLGRGGALSFEFLTMRFSTYVSDDSGPTIEIRNPGFRHPKARKPERPELFKFRYGSEGSVP